MNDTDLVTGCGCPPEAEAPVQPTEDNPGVAITGHCRYRHRSPQEARALIHRLNRIEGQVRGIRGMVERDVYCPDILVQVAAANAALNSLTKELLDQHLRTCVANDLRAGNEESIDELLKILQRLMR